MNRSSISHPFGKLFFGTLLLFAVCTSPLHAQTEESPPRATKRSQHLAFGSHHSISVHAGYMLNTIIYTKKSDSGTLNDGLNIGINYSWISRKGIGAGLFYSGSFASAQRNGLTRTARIHYFAPEIVFRQRVGKRWLFRESAGIGYGQYIRRYGDTSDSRGNIGFHVVANVEYMLTKNIGLGVNLGYGAIFTQMPDVGDGLEVPFVALLNIHYGGGLQFYF